MAMMIKLHKICFDNIKIRCTLLAKVSPYAVMPNIISCKLVFWFYVEFISCRNVVIVTLSGVPDRGCCCRLFIIFVYYKSLNCMPAPSQQNMTEPQCAVICTLNHIIKLIFKTRFILNTNNIYYKYLSTLQQNNFTTKY